MLNGLNSSHVYQKHHLIREQYLKQLS